MKNRMGTILISMLSQTKRIAFFLLVVFLISIHAFAFEPLFNTRIDYTVGENPVSICNADFNSDGNIDLAVANRESYSVSILKNSGNGTFDMVGEYPLTGNPESICAVDIDGDGNIDLAIPTTGKTTVSFLRNNGDCTFIEAEEHPLVGYPKAICAADFDTDGKIDLAVANSDCNYVSILRNKGNWVFEDTVNYKVGDSCISIVTSDFDSDEKPDLAVTSGRFASVYILKNKGNGTFAASIKYFVGSLPNGIVAADFNKDGKTDLATSNYNSRDISILRNIGNGIFDTALNFTIENPSDSSSKTFDNGFWKHPEALCAVDFDGDGNIDLAVVDHTWMFDHPTASFVTILKNQGNGSFSPVINFLVDIWPVSIIASDFDQDNKPDLAFANLESNSVSVLKNTMHDSNSVGEIVFLRGGGIKSFTPVDSITFENRDLRIDSISPNTISITKFKGKDTIKSEIPFQNDSCSTDLNGFGGYISMSDNPNLISIKIRKGDSIYSHSIYYNVDNKFNSVCFCDLDNDGLKDLAADKGSSISVFRNNGNGTFSTAVNYGILMSSRCIKAADVNGDGLIDLIIRTAFDDYSILLNCFTPQQSKTKK